MSHISWSDWLTASAIVFSIWAVGFSIVTIVDTIRRNSAAKRPPTDD